MGRLAKQVGRRVQATQESSGIGGPVMWSRSTFPSRLHVDTAPDDKTVQAAMYGPLVLAAQMGDEGLTTRMIYAGPGPQWGDDGYAMPVVDLRPIRKPGGTVADQAAGQNPSETGDVVRACGGIARVSADVPDQGARAGAHAGAAEPNHGRALFGVYEGGDDLTAVVSCQR